MQNKWANDIGTEVMLRRGFTKCYIAPEFQTAHYGPNTPKRSKAVSSHKITVVISSKMGNNYVHFMHNEGCIYCLIFFLNHKK